MESFFFIAGMLREAIFVADSARMLSIDCPARTGWRPSFQQYLHASCSCLLMQEVPMSGMKR